MANGYSLPILKHIASIAGTDPAKKISPMGFLQMLLSRMDDSVQWSENYSGGHETQLKVKYRKRPLKSEVRDNEDGGCNTASTSGYTEYTVPNLIHRETSFHLPTSMIRQYQKDASDHVKLDPDSKLFNMNKETTVMREVYSMFIEYGNVLLSSINEAVVTQMAAQFGKNTTTGDNATKAVSFSLGTVAMQDALITLMTDWRENEMTDDVAFVGSGPFANLDLVKKFYSTLPNSQGFNMAYLNNFLSNTWFDKDCRAIWGANQVGVFAKGAAHLLVRDMYAGNFAQRLATSEYFNMALPTMELNGGNTQFLDRLKFDIQIKEVDCATEIDLGGVPTVVKEGVIVFLKKKFNLFTLPELYQDADPLNGTNGTLRYTITAT